MQFLSTTAGQAALIGLFFLFIVLFLRKLYGPKGWFRDPAWDDMNKKQREQDQAGYRRKRVNQLASLLERECAVFDSYVREFMHEIVMQNIQEPAQPENGHGNGQKAQPAGKHSATSVHSNNQQKNINQDANNQEDATGNSPDNLPLEHQDERLEMYRLKREHSLQVLTNAIELVAGEDELCPAPGQNKTGQTANKSSATNSAVIKGSLLEQGLREPDAVLLLAALYHDIGRFEQLKQYNTFRDADSINHGLLGGKILASDHFMADENEGVRAMARLAVLVHNRYALPRLLHPALTPVCLALRDADKLDILRIMSEELEPGHSPDPTVLLGLEDRPEGYSQHLMQKALERENIAYGDLRLVNDMRILLCGWVEGLAFATSRKLLRQRGYMDKILAGLPQDEYTAQLTRLVEKALAE